MNIIEIVGIALTGALLSLWIGQINRAFGVYVMVAAGVLLLFCCYDGIRMFMDFMEVFFTRLSDQAVYLKILCKLVGIAYLCEFTSSICKDAGCMSLSSQVEVVGRLLMIVCALPILTNLLTVIEEVFSSEI